MRLFHLISILDIKSILSIALLLRVIWACLVPVDPVSDSFLYDAFAKSIATGNGYAFPNGDITVYWPVGTSAIYAALYQLFGFSYLPIVIFNIAIGSFIVWLTFEIAQRYLDKSLALIAALLVAIWPILIQFTTILASELIFILLVLLTIYVWGAKNIQPVIRAIIWGALVCAATFVRPTALPMLVLLPALEWLANGKLRACIMSLCIASITLAVLFSPWVSRNYQIFGEFVLVSANGGANLWMGNNPKSNGGYMELTNLDFKNEVARDNYFKKVAINFILHNPLSYVKLAVHRVLITYKAETIGIIWNGYLEKHLNKPVLMTMKLISTFYWWALVGLACLGIYNISKDRKLKLFHVLFVMPAFFFVFPILTVAQDRYHLPINPFLAIFAAYAMQQLFRKRQILSKP